MLLALLACSPAPEDTGAPFTPSPYIYEEAEAPPPLLDAGALEAALDNTLLGVAVLNAAPVLSGYARVIGGMEAGCPDFYDADGTVYWYDQCTTSGGSSYSGYGIHVTYDATDVGDGLLYYGAGFSGVAQVTDAEGHTFEAGGTAYALRGEAETHAAYQSVLQGAFGWDGPEADGTWLTGEVTPELNWYAVVAAGDIARAVYVDGGISGFDGEIGAVVFDDVLLVDAGWGGACPSEPGGVISVRDLDGGWYDILLDGPAEWGGTSDPALCDGCGEAFYRGESIGSVCADFPALLGWEGTPW